MSEGTAGILGTGLIGTSIGLGLVAAGWEVLGFDIDDVALRTAHDRHAVSKMAANEADLVAASDLLVVAVPPSEAPSLLTRLRTDALVTDVTGVKAKVAPAGAHLSHFVSSHPMAGREISGPAAATATLFYGAAWIIVTDETKSADVEVLARVIRSLGAIPVRMTAADHDETIAVLSQLPQLLASMLVTHAAEELGDLSAAGGGFRDLTRVAASDPETLSALAMENRWALAETVDKFILELRRWVCLLESGEHEHLRDELAAAAEIQKGLHPPLGVVEVMLLDRPGELAAVGRALQHSRVDVRDLQFRHTAHGAALLRVFVRENDVAALCAALHAGSLTVASDSCGTPPSRHR